MNSMPEHIKVALVATQKTVEFAMALSPDPRIGLDALLSAYATVVSSHAGNVHECVFMLRTLADQLDEQRQSAHGCQAGNKLH